MPDMVFPAVNHRADSFRISDARGKLLLLEFWTSSCGTCIMQFPKITKLNEHFRNELVIMPVGINTRTRNSGKFFAENLINDPTVQLSTAIVNYPDSIFHSYFPYTTMPHVIWIGDDQKILAITDHTAVNKGNIEKVLRGDSADFRMKPLLKRLEKEAVFLIPDTTLLRGSVLHPVIDSLRDSYWPEVFVSGQRRVLRVINMSVISVYRNLYKRVELLEQEEVPQDLFAHKHISMEDGFPFQDPFEVSQNWDNYQMDKFRQENMFCYEYVAPATISLVDFYRNIISDLDLKLGVSSGVEVRMVSHGILSVTPNFHLRRQSHVEKSQKLGYFEKLAHVDRLSSIANRLEYRKDFPEPIRHIGNDLKIDPPIYLNFKDDCTRQDILEYLGKIGIQFSHSDKLVKILVLK